MKTRAHHTLNAQLWWCAFIALTLFGVNPGLHAKESANMQWTVTRHTWGEDLSGSLQGAGGIGGLLRSTIVEASTNGTPKTEHEHTFSYDSNGNVILLTDTQGRESARYAYDAFVKTLTATGPAARVNRYRFSTKPVEEESGLVYYGYRYYDTVTARWPSRDSIEEKGGVNIYSFVNNGGVTGIDLLGQQPCVDPCGEFLSPGVLLAFQNADIRGIVVCCDGVKYSCPIPGNVSPLVPPGSVGHQIIESCINAHEQDHFDDVECGTMDCAGPPSRPEFAGGVDPNQAECNAYNVELNCLQGKIGQCNGINECILAVTVAIANAQHKKAIYCGN